MLVKRVIETFSDRTKKVHESVLDFEASGENFEEGNKRLDAHERNI